MSHIGKRWSTPTWGFIPLKIYGQNLTLEDGSEQTDPLRDPHDLI